MEKITNSNSTREELIDLITRFVRSKGIETSEQKIDGDSFFRGISIDKGVLIIERENLIYPGDLLHEAGHIAVVLPEERIVLSDNVTVDRPGNEGEEMSVMLWTWAACLEMNMDPAIVFHENGYRGQSQWLMEQYQQGNYIGLSLLVWMGLAKDSKEKGGFPQMIKWLR